MINSDTMVKEKESGESILSSDRGKFNLLYKILKVSDESAKITGRLEDTVDRIGKTLSFDALSPAAVAQRAEASGVTKTKSSVLTTVLLGILAGIFIGFGAVLFTMVTTDSGLGFGVGKLLGGLVFCLGLILVIVAGAELFTGNALIIIGWLSGKLSFSRLLRNWGLVYFANLAGSLILVGLVFSSEQWAMNNYAVGANALTIAQAKVNLTFGTALVRGILCNVLVCLAVWLCLGARTVMEKILAIVFPITAFVVAGFEHSIANMFFIPMGIAVAKQPEVLSAAGLTVESVANVSWSGFISNIIPVTIGNIIGGIAVGAAYWVAYLRGNRATELAKTRQWMKAFIPGKAQPAGAGSAADNPVSAQIDTFIQSRMRENRQQDGSEAA